MDVLPIGNWNFHMKSTQGYKLMNQEKKAQKGIAEKGRLERSV